jgi:hypothetical protein
MSDALPFDELDLEIRRSGALGPLNVDYAHINLDPVGKFAEWP